MDQHVRVALAQWPPDGNPVLAIAASRRAGADIVVFPELFSNGLASFDATDPIAREQWCKNAHTVEGEYVGVFRRAGRQEGVHVVTTFLEAAEPLPFNTALLIAPDGRTILHHRKVHVCDFDSPECATARGHGFDVGRIQTTAGPVAVGLMICMDREYPEPARALSRGGAEICWSRTVVTSPATQSLVMCGSHKCAGGLSRALLGSQLQTTPGRAATATHSRWMRRGRL
jgi:predicted amidohydrolase